MKGQASRDFRDWNIAPETSFRGVDANGLPFYIWRESADNRLGLARPRYCCITPHEGRLYFTFFNPSEDTKPSGGWAVFWVVGCAWAFGRLAWAWYHPAPPMPYHLDESAPPFLVLLSAVFSGGMLGGLAGSSWHVVVTLWRWIFGRFPGQGRLSFVPYESLSGFREAHAGQIGAKIDGKEAKTGHGLVAVVDDGAMLVLTGNAWDYTSIVAKHRDLTLAFFTERGEITRQWALRQKQAPVVMEPQRVEPRARDEVRAHDQPRPPSSNDIPDTI